MQRIWLDWSAPCLPLAARWMMAQFSPGSTLAQSSAGGLPVDLDLGDWIVVLPGRRPGQVLLHELAVQTDDRGLALIPPTITTPGGLVDVVLSRGDAVAQPATATSLECRLAWARALQGISEEERARLVPHPPDEGRLLGWLELAGLIERLHADLIGAMKRFDDVAEAAARLELFGEHDRWRALCSVEKQYHRVLGERGLVDPQSKRLQGIEQVAEGASSSQQGHYNVLLVGIAELNALQRRVLQLPMLDVTSLIHAPEDMADHFDDFGCVTSEKWGRAPLSVPDDVIAVADRLADQARTVVEYIAKLNADSNGELRVSDLTVGMGDESLAPFIESAGRWAGLSFRPAMGVPLARTPPCRLLSAVADWLNEPRFATFAALLRHHDIERLIDRQKIGDDQSTSVGCHWLGLLDEQFSRHLQQDISGTWRGGSASAAVLKRIHDFVQEWLAPLRGEPRSPAEWCQPILDCLARVYAVTSTARDDTPWSVIRESLQTIRDTAAELADCVMWGDKAGEPKRIASDHFTVTSSDAIRVLLSEAARRTIALPRGDDDIDVLGWLELHLDPAPSLIVTTVNDGSIPRTVRSDPFLPDSLRAVLGMTCNATRLARDAYLMEATLHSRRNVTLISGRRDPAGEILAPSRLLLRVPRDELPPRVSMLTDDRRAVRYRRPRGGSAPAEQSRFIIPPPPAEPPELTYMTVTAFRAYLACPYRYWLQYHAGLEGVTDAVEELDPLAFGTLAHQVLEAFGRSETAYSDDAGQITEFLLDDLHTRATKTYGRRPLPAVRVQIERLGRRLEVFAERQADTRREGWVIRETELSFREEDNYVLEMSEDEMPVILGAKIDRIDYHEDLQRWRIIDYKTSESAESPEKAHWGRETFNNEWTDLQLPLYGYLLRQRNYDGPMDMGFFTLGGSLPKIGLKPAKKFDEEILAAAIDEARRIVRAIRAGDFEVNPKFSRPDDEFARICQVTAINDFASSADDGGDE